MPRSSERDLEKDLENADSPSYDDDKEVTEGDGHNGGDDDAELGPTRSIKSEHGIPIDLITGGGDQQQDVEFSVFTKRQKRFIVFMAAWAGFFSPVSSQIYYPALNSLSSDLSVSTSLINLTLTSYMVVNLFRSSIHSIHRDAR